MSKDRRSLSSTATLKGKGLHTGADTAVSFGPAEPGQGVVFRRADQPNSAAVLASADNVLEVDRRTSIGTGDTAIETVEHVLAAIAAHQLDDVMVEVDGPEVPVLDGSAAPFFDALADAGPISVAGRPTVYQIRHPFTVREGEASYIVAPGESLNLTVTIEWDHPLIGTQAGSFQITPESFRDRLAPARTFGFAAEAEEIAAKGLGKGADTASIIVLSDDGVIDTELKWPDEFVRHKTVDLLGDLALLNGRFSGSIVAQRPSHKGNLALVKAIRRAAGFKVPPVMGIQEILGVIPHRYPMLLVDRIVEMEEGKRIVGIKNVTMNEPFFQGHFPEHPIMPGVLIIEAMGQVGGMLLMGSVDKPEDKVVYFMGINNVKFRRPVIPGDQIRFELEMIHFRGRNCQMRGIGYVDGDRVAEAEMMARVVDR
jgi:UDP-3-O-[3-hydroxymyristoyl] N-acetylglucosamine deacetylase/3-hydroxyacyl-[acyl-carrier-protein] dehydratase